MKKTAALLLICALLLTLLLPFALPSGALIEARREEMMEAYWQEQEGGLLRWLIPGARAEQQLDPLPIDFSPGREPKPDGFTETGYLDDSIELRLETIEQDGLILRVAYINIAHPSQLRTATASKLGSKKVALISSMAKAHNAVLAFNANYLSNDPVKTSFEYRMGERIRSKPNREKDLLIIDENGDFNLFIKSQAEEIEAFEEAGHTIVNAFTFGPALVKDGELLALNDKYGYNPHGREPRLAFGQLAPLSYIVVLAEGRRRDSEGLTQAELAQVMYDLACVQAFNLDGGNSATLVFNGGYYHIKTKANERAQSDMIYFASLMGE